MLICRVDCVSLNILHRDYPKPLVPINSLMATDFPRPLDDTAAPPSGHFLRSVYIPLEPSAEQISVDEAALVAEFETVFDQDGGLRQMVDPDMVIQLRDDAVLFYVNGARPIAFGDRTELKCKLDDLVKKKVIVPVSEPSEWAAPLVVIHSASGKLRLCVDHTRLNKFVQRPTHPTRTPRDAVAEIDIECRFFISFDAVNGYYQTPPSPLQPASYDIYDAMGAL